MLLFVQPLNNKVNQKQKQTRNSKLDKSSSSKVKKSDYEVGGRDVTRMANKSFFTSVYIMPRVVFSLIIKTLFADIAIQFGVCLNIVVRIKASDRHNSR